MNILRKFALFVFSLLLFIALPLNTLAWTTKQSLMDREVILGWLKEGKVYDNIADSVAQIAEDNLNKTDENQPVDGQSQEDAGQMPDTATLIKAAKTALPPNVLQENVEAVINSSYDWLEGKTDTIVLNLDLSDEKKAFIDALGNEAIVRAASLPTCTAEQVSDFDPLSSECIPSGTNVAAQADKIKNELASSKDFIPDTSITSADLTVGEEGSKKLISEQFETIPGAFKNAQNSALIMTIAVAIFCVAVFLLGKNRKSGLKINAWIFGLAGIWALVLGLVFRLGNTALANAVVNNSDANIGSSAISALLAQITGTLFQWHVIIGGAYVVVAILCIVAMKLMNKNSAPKTPDVPLEEKPKTKTTQSPKPVASVKAQPTKPPKRQNLIQ